MKLSLTLAEAKALYRLVGHHVISGSTVNAVHDQLFTQLRDEGIDPYHLPPVPSATFPHGIHGNRPMVQFED